MQRFCPHAGEDLAHADVTHDEIEAGVLECPRHHWKWRLDTGECVAGGTVPLRVAPAGDEHPARQRVDTRRQPSDIGRQPSDMRRQPGEPCR
nr:Rieske 2Fe-2S domain-containing protein [Streptomyces sp. SID3343]